MSLVKWAFFGLLLLPVAEIVVFVAVAIQFGFLAALALTILTSLAGMAVIRRAGHREVERVRTAFGDRVLTRVEIDGPGFLTVLGGFLLILPGFLTDILGALLLLPAVRRLIHATLRRVVGAAERRAQGDVVELEPDQWRRMPEERIGRSPMDHAPDEARKP